MTTEPKIYSQGRNRWVILDQPGTPFWLASFRTQSDALKAWETFQTNLVNFRYWENCDPWKKLENRDRGIS